MEIVNGLRIFFNNLNNQLKKQMFIHCFSIRIEKCVSKENKITSLYLEIVENCGELDYRI